LRQRNQAATPPNIQASEEPIANAPAYQMVKDETFAQTQPRLNLATFVTTYMDDYATKLFSITFSEI